jgi:DNA-binding transcriptional ArsR family regulator
LTAGDWRETGRGPAAAVVARVASALGDPLRAGVVTLLDREPEQTLTSMATRLAVTPSRLANHLAILREAGLLTSRKAGRTTHYALAQPALARDALGALAALGGRAAAARGEPAAADPEPGRTDFERARVCYDHLAGQVGVALYDYLVRAGALHPTGTGETPLEPGPALPTALRTLGVPEVPRAGRRQLAVGCMDSTERRPHVAGAVGAAILAALLRQGLAGHGEGPRSLVVARDLDELLAT